MVCGWRVADAAATSTTPTSTAREELMRNKKRSNPGGEVSKRGVTSAVPGYPGTEEELIAAAKNGDEGAFATLVKHHQKRIFALALRYTRVREDAEDVVQQTFHKAFVYVEQFEGKSSFATWLTRIAINEALMLLRRRRALREEFMDATNSDDRETPGLNMADAGPDPEVTYLEREGARILSAAIAQLRPSLRTVIELQGLGELTSRETAGRMGLSVSAVKARLFHGRRKLRKALGHYMRLSRSSGAKILSSDPNANLQNRETCSS